MEPRYDTLFYDGQCPLCAREIRTLRKLQRGNLIFADIHEQRDGSTSLPSHEALLRRLHMMTWSGEWVIGLPANARAWSHTPFGFLFKPLLWPGIYRIASRIYGSWADKRYEHKYACATGNNKAA
ncbi:thiol-disulfide oxidoreductase DCC family protein [Marinobacter sp.]|uniref:thiol-disulfide oxidoreductase DCC family protein n=1 Tax=Marinobacter sp. TaxID=50741 RepID=UPI003A949E14